MAIAMEIYEKIRYYREHTDYRQRNVAKILGVSRNTVKKYWEGQNGPWERKPGSGRKNDIITNEVKDFIIKCMRYTLVRSLSQVTKWVRLKFAALNLKKYALHSA